MIVTVAICTWNRSKLLDQTLTRLGAAHVPAGIEWELLVVNNNSPDDTEGVIDQHRRSGRLPIRALLETKQGLSHARNKALEEARGEILIWADDDVLVGADWISQYARAAERYPAAGFFGGPVRPWFSVPPPRWVERQYRSVGWVWALLEPETEERPLRREEPVFGANMAFRTDVLRRYRFNPRLGHVGATAGGGDEIELQARMQADGYDGIWLPTNPVEHYVPAERMTLRYVWTRAAADGRCLYDPAQVAGHAKIAGVPRWLVRAFLSASVRARVGRLMNSAHWLGWYVRAAWCSGAIAAARRVHSGSIG